MKDIDDPPTAWIFFCVLFVPVAVVFLFLNQFWFHISV